MGFYLHGKLCINKMGCHLFLRIDNRLHIVYQQLCSCNRHYHFHCHREFDITSCDISDKRNIWCTSSLLCVILRSANMLQFMYCSSNVFNPFLYIDNCAKYISANFWLWRVCSVDDFCNYTRCSFLKLCKHKIKHSVKLYACACYVIILNR
jgi:hypothetical protein